MLFYVLGTLFFVVGLFGYAKQDLSLSFDNGEKAAAGWMLGHHNGIVLSCRNGQLTCDTGTTPTLLARDNTYQPAYLVRPDGTSLQLGVDTVSYGENLFSFYELTPSGTLPSRGRNLSLSLVGARLYDATLDYPEGTDLWTGTYSAGASAVVVSNRFTAQATADGYDAVHSQSAGVGPLKDVVIPVNFAGMPIADGAPVLVSPVPCLQATGQCLGTAGDFSTPTPSTKGGLSGSGSTPATVPSGSIPGTPPSPVGVWDPGQAGGVGTTVPATPSPVIVTKPVLGSAALGDCTT